MSGNTDERRLRDLLDQTGDANSFGRDLLRAFIFTEEIPRSEIESPPPLDLSGADYLIALDDSGGIEPLINPQKQFIGGTSWVTVIAAYGLPVSELSEFNFAWNELRTMIKRRLNLSYLPPIHMRHMFGRDLPTKLEGRPNPYKLANFHNQIMPWLDYARNLLSYFTTRQNNAIEKMYFGDRRYSHSLLIQYLNRTKLWGDLRYLQSHYKNQYKFALSRLGSPLPKLLALQIGLLNEILKAKNKTAILIIDNFDASQGIASQTVQELVRRLGFEQIIRIYRAERMSDIPLLQAADVFAWDVNRMQLEAHNFAQPSGLLPLMMVNPDQAAAEVNRNWDLHAFAQNYNLQFVLQYSLFREAVSETRNVRSLYDKLIHPDELEKRLLNSTGRKRRPLTLFIDDSLSKGY